MFRVTGLCVGNSLVSGEFLTQMASKAENVSIWWHHHEPLVEVMAEAELTASNYLNQCWLILLDPYEQTSGTFELPKLFFEKSICKKWDISFSHRLTHWGRVTHIGGGEQTIIGSDNGLSPGRRQAIIWTNAGILSIGPLGTNFNETLH